MAAGLPVIASDWDGLRETSLFELKYIKLLNINN
jgi:hypothetical protein